MTSMGTPAPGKRQRRWAPKKRTGCLSCKQRRVRCDEAHPTCQRCLKDRFTCEWDTQVTKTQQRARSDERVADTGTNGISTPSSSLPNEELEPEEVVPNTTSPEDDFQLTHKASAPSLLPTYRTPASPYGREADYAYLSFFLRNVGPLLSTTKAWRNLWERTVPQCAWTSDAIRHAMIAVAASYESFRVGCERNEVVLKETNLAIGAFRRDEGSRMLSAGTESTFDQQNYDVALLLCRILASVYQAQGDWTRASAHMGWGAKILRQIADERRPKFSFEKGLYTTPISNIAKTLAPSFMCVLNEAIQEGNTTGLDCLPEDKRKIWTELLRFRTLFRALFVKWTKKVWPHINRAIQAYLLTAWSTLNHAMSSALHPDLVSFNEEDPIKSVGLVEQELKAKGKLYNLHELSASTDLLFDDLDNFLLALPDLRPTLPGLEVVEGLLAERLRTCLENYLVQAAIFEPRMSAGTFWSDAPEETCSIWMKLKKSDPSKVLPFVSEMGVITNSTEAERQVDGFDERQKFYLEHVCPYRSGFMPARCDEDLCSLTSVHHTSNLSLA